MIQIVNSLQAAGGMSQFSQCSRWASVWFQSRSGTISPLFATIEPHCCSPALLSVFSASFCFWLKLRASLASITPSGNHDDQLRPCNNQQEDLDSVSVWRTADGVMAVIGKVHCVWECLCTDLYWSVVIIMIITIKIFSHIWYKVLHTAAGKLKKDIKIKTIQLYKL